MIRSSRLFVKSLFHLRWDRVEKSVTDRAGTVGATPVGRMRAVYSRRTSRRQCSAAFFKPARHNSLVDYISPQSVNAIPVKPVSFSSLPSASELPLISTSPETQSGSIQGTALASL